MPFQASVSDLSILSCPRHMRHWALPCCLPLTACGQPPRTHSAAAFFETTTYRLPGGHAWSADGQRLLIGADTLGALNAHALLLSGVPATALSASADNVHRPLSWFPSDDRVLCAADNQGDELDHVHVLAPKGPTLDLTPGEGVKALAASEAFVGFLGKHLQ